MAESDTQGTWDPSESGGGLAGEEPADPRRYVDQGPLGRGAMGEVRRVWDRRLDCLVAMKLLGWEQFDAAGVRARFQAEATVTARLQHPGIVAVHDRGLHHDGRPFYTMPEVRGETLEARIARVHSQGRAAEQLRQLLDVLRRVCEAMAYAHSQGVVHRDLKPANIMVGRFGQVLVMDWGLARRLASPSGAEHTPAGLEGPSPLDSLTASQTRQGEVVGTPAYMAPEQASGDPLRVGCHSDVYALGVILYEMLTGQTPLSGSGDQVWRRLLEGPPPLFQDAELPRSPEALQQLCAQAMAYQEPERMADAGVLGDALGDWLDGARRRVRAMQILDKAQGLRPEIDAMRARGEAARDKASQLLGALMPHDPVEKKRPGWQLEDESAALLGQAVLKETAWLQAVRSALEIEPELGPAHRVLAQHYCDRLLEAEALHRSEDAIRYETLLRSHDQGEFAAVLRGEGRFTLVTEPPGARVLLERYVQRDRMLVPEPAGELGVTPLVDCALPHGSYRLRLQLEGHREVLYPVALARGEVQDGVRPGGDAPFPIRLPVLGEMEDDDCYVPAGWFWAGGDPEAVEAFPRQRIWVDAFVIKKYPVTNAQYLEFLNDLVAQGREREALRFAPQKDVVEGDETLFERDEEGRFGLGVDQSGVRWEGDWPVSQVSWNAARSFAEWTSAQGSLALRLSDELEWEKAARGVDGRYFASCMELDQPTACVVGHRPEGPARASVMAFPADRSPFEVAGMVGNVRDWCDNLWGPSPSTHGGLARVVPAASQVQGFRALRGGAWSSTPQLCRAAIRFANTPEQCLVSTGFRLARACLQL